MNNQFDELYKRLNDEQRQAVDTLEGPVMVVAGPGTGKTQVLTLRIANILRTTSVRPEAILALTFTETGAHEMRRRLAEFIGAPAYRVNIFTFHGFCNDVIETHPDAFGDLAGRVAADEITQLEALEAAFGKCALKVLRPFGDTAYYVKPAQKMISDLKRQGVSPDAFELLLLRERAEFSGIDDLYYASGAHKGKMKGKYQKREGQIAKNSELAQVYRAYQEELGARKIYDYDDMILEVVTALSNNDSLLLELQDAFSYMLVDEHQDTNNAQNRVLELLAGGSERPNLFVVGDEKQAIFRFQGASIENFLYFKKRFPGARLIMLVSNYRSTQLILDLAQSVIAHNRRSIGALVEGMNSDLIAALTYMPALAQVYELSDTPSEYYFVAKKIAELVDQSVPREEIAVLYRENREGELLGTVLGRMGIPYRIESARNMLDEPMIRKFLSLLRAVDDLSREDLLFAALHVDFLGIAPFDVYKMTGIEGRRPKLLELMRDVERLKAMGVETPEVLAALAEKLLSWHQRARQRDASSVISDVIGESGMVIFLMGGDDGLRHMGELRALMKTVRALAEGHRDFRLTDFLRYVDLLETHGLAIKDERRVVLPGAVRLMTAHGAKGLEFDYVFIINVADGHWGNKRSRSLFRLPASEPPDDDAGDRLDEERRLFYVALTRARRMVFLSHATEGPTGRAQMPSLFLGELKPELVECGDATAYAIDEHERYGGAPVSKETALLSEHDRQLLVELFYRRPFSVSALNNYLTCPWQYFYMSLVRMPRAANRFARYGNAVHHGLKSFFDALKKGPADRAALVADFRQALNGEALTSAELDEFFRKGTAALEGYYDRYHETWSTKTENEFRLTGMELPAQGTLRAFRLTGTLDKMEYLTSNDVNVVDYKTGRPKSRATLEGQTKNADGNYKRQLVFYKLLLEAGTSLRIASGEIDFVEPDKKGVYHREKFIIEDAEVKELRDLIYATAEKITTFAFWNERCGKSDCEFCRLRYGSF